MQRIVARVTGRAGHKVAAALSMLAFAGCSTPYLPPEPVVAEPEPIVLEPPIAEIRTEVLERTPLPPILPPVSIVLSGNQPAYADVAHELKQRFKSYRIFDLSENNQVPVSVLRMINDSNSGAVVAIGPRAARSSVAMAEKPVVFSQVFNYSDNELLQGNSRGVAAIAPMGAQLAAWKEIDPRISRVGVIVGAGHEDLIADAEVAAERQGIDLNVQITRSDQETLYVFRRMIRDIDAFWLLPDSRVLSSRVLRQILTDAGRRQVSVSVPNEAMLQLGATISMSTVASDIAETIVRIVHQIQAGELHLVPPVTQLSEIRIATSNTVQVVER